MLSQAAVLISPLLYRNADSVAMMDLMVVVFMCSPQTRLKNALTYLPILIADPDNEIKRGSFASSINF
jgi:hypothetical protein